ncbi:MAG: serine/threonine-protein kinase [Gemmatimonadaceae bacterium]
MTRFCASDGQVLRDEGSQDDWLVGKLVADRYYIERQLGVGGMGVVYLAQQVYMSRRCALKVLRPEFLKNTDAVGRFARGAQNASRISHPNVAAVYDFGEIEGESMYLAMEYVDGESLGSVLEATGKLPIARVATIISQVASALKAAHELGIVHRDLKPDNIMITRSGESADLVKVVDFGIARAILQESQDVTSSGISIGTPAYMSPEQITGDKVDPRSDVYSLALVTYVMLAGSLPLGAEPLDLAVRFLQKPKPLRELDPLTEWPDELQGVLDRALAWDAADRHENVQQFARELIDALRNWQPADIASSLSSLTMLGADVTSALPPDMIVRWATPQLEQPALAATGTRSGKRRRLVMAGSGALVVAALGTIAVLTLMNRAETARKQVTAAEPTPLKVDSAARALSALASKVEGNVQAVAPVAEPERGAPASRNLTAATNRPSARQLAEAGVRPSVGNESAPAADSTTSHTKAPDSVVAPAVLPTTGVIRIGTPAMLGAALYMNGELVGVLAGLRNFTVPAGPLRLRLHLEQCRDWDSTVMVGRGDTVVVGTRRPACAP